MTIIIGNVKGGRGSTLKKKLDFALLSNFKIISTLKTTHTDGMNAS